MAFYKGTQKQCEDYDNFVSQKENYQGTTIKWSEVMEIEEEFFIAKHPSYSSDMVEVDKLPVIDEII